MSEEKTIDDLIYEKIKERYAEEYTNMLLMFGYVAWDAIVYNWLKWRRKK